MPEPASIDARAETALAWARLHAGFEFQDIEAVSSDASFRRYFRISGDHESRIVMDAPPGRETTAPFVDIARRLRIAGLNAPEVLAEDRKRGFLLLTDLGDRPGTMF